MKETTSDVSATQSRGVLTMYERSVLQKEERERKLKALQETLMADFTFTPNKKSSGDRPRSRTGSGESVVSSLGDSPSMAGIVSSSGISIFSRLYSAETVASRAQQHTPRTKTSDRFGFALRTPTSTAASVSGRSHHSGNTSKTASPRLESLYKAGQEKLRARHLSDQEEVEQMKRRIENELLKLPGVYTFRPQTKWDIVAQRRKMALEGNEREEEGAYRTMPKTINTVSIFL